MAYIDGFVAPAPAANRDAYRKFAAEAATLFKEYGATRVVETWGDDVPDGKVTDFKGAVKAEDGEVIVFSWVEYPDKATRDAAGKKMMEDPRMETLGDMPFDGKRMIYGGFEVVLDKGPGGAMGYVDGAIQAVPTANKRAYADMNDVMTDVIRECGATRIVDGWGDHVPDGKITDYRSAVKATDEETVTFSWIEWPSKAARDAGWAKVMADPRMHRSPEGMPFDPQRRVYGGFDPLLDA